MTYAAITGWGKAMPPAVLTNADLSTFLDTNDEWIVSRTGMKQRRISHVSGVEMATVAAKRALACAGLDAGDVDLIVYGSCSSDEQVPNAASGVQHALGAQRAASMDVNTACTSFLYALSTATAMIRTGVVRNAVVIGVEIISPYMDWNNRNVAVLFGDGCAAVVVQASEQQEGLLGEQLGCVADARHTLRVRGMGTAYTNSGVTLGDTEWDFDGQEIFKRAVQGMVQASTAVMAKCGVTPDDIDLVVPHQANLRIIEAVVTRSGLPMDKVMLTVERYGNMSAATVPVALAEAMEEGRVKPGALILMPAFGGGLTFCSHLVRWGERVTPLAQSEAELAPAKASALDLVNQLRARKAGALERSHAGLQGAKFLGR
ncbi:MAG: ketoacyl-ACP synthase III [Hyphomonadaceae bacterium]|nr:ketoacyl-ACP synthase III [Hyphomonadaceae bacterium]MBX3510234.1 ketoacyl-ACP synthase III [Hyphomonadaceae bacterium]